MKQLFRPALPDIENDLPKTGGVLEAPLLLLPGKIDDSRFFPSINPDQKEEPFEPRSVAIIYAFSQWKEDLPDPLNTWSLEQIVSQYKLFSPRNRYFWEFIKANFPGHAKKVKGNS